MAPIIQYGAIPVFVDITLAPYNIDCDFLEAALSPKTRAVMLAHTLRLDITKARTILSWSPRWNLEQALKQPVDRHRAWLAGEDMQAFTLRQIELYQSS